MPRHPRIHSCLFLVLISLLWPYSAGTLAATTGEKSEDSTRHRVLDRFVSLTTLEVQLFADAADGSLDKHSLLAAALIASGVDDPEMVCSYENQVAVLADRLRRSGTVKGSPQEQVQAIFEFMHREMLYGGYRLDATDMTTVLREGRFNCVSSSVLFCCLCSRFGIKAEGLEIPGHAMTRVELPDGELRIEATCPQWFRLIDDPQRREELIRRTVGRQAAKDSIGAARLDRKTPIAGKKDGFRSVSGVELVATIYYNRGVDLLASRQFAQAMAANCKAVRLDCSNKTAWGNLLATLNNWAIAIGSKGQFEKAVSLLEIGLTVEPDFQAFASNYTHVYHRWVEELCSRGRHQDALEQLGRAAAIQPNEPWFLQASQDVLKHWSQTRANTAMIDTSVPVLHDHENFSSGRIKFLETVSGQ
ncbi:MAG: hypothetical protein JXM70_23915 [Pirellulales bacterium]|nr:hypothetical protein [Pirellulales bacterium]